MAELTQERLKELLDYDPATGEFRFRASRGTRVAGSIAGSHHKDGYSQIRLTVSDKQKSFLSHRLAWLYMVGTIPGGQIDHVDGNRKNNRWPNLRSATQSQNMGNRRRNATNRAGLKGVCLRGNRFGATIRINGKRRRLGNFDTAEAAHAAYCAAAAEGFGEFANGG